MRITRYITADKVFIDDCSTSKTAVLLQVSQVLSQSEIPLDAQSLFDSFWKREVLGSTTIGHGVTIPHIRIDDIDTIRGCFIKLKHPVDFGAEDKQPIDIVIGYIVPTHATNEHLETLARTSQLFSNEHFRSLCREAPTSDRLFQCLNEQDKKLQTNQPTPTIKAELT